MNRTTLSLIAAVAALAAVTGVATLTEPSERADTSATTAARLPVERSSLVCPAPTSSDVGETTYTAFTPKRKDADEPKGAAQKADKSTAQLLPAADGTQDDLAGGKGERGERSEKGGERRRGPGGDPVVPLKEPGVPVTATADGGDAPALTGTADGRLAPGWTVQQTTVVDAGMGRGLLGASCTAPDTEFWFPATSTAADRQDYVHLTNPDDTAAEVDLELYGPEGRVDEAQAGEAIPVPPHSTVPVLLSTLSSRPEINLTLHVAVRSGRVGAMVQASDTNLGGDWLPASADAASTVVLPGIPKDATAVRLVAFATGDDDADLKVRLAGGSGTITPAGNATLHVKSKMTAAMDLGDVTKGEAGSLVLTAEGGGPRASVVAALRVTRGKGSKQETAFIPATGPIEERGTVADNRAKGTTLSLVAPGETAKVRVTSSPGTGGGSAASEEYTVKGGTTKAVSPPLPNGGKGAYAVTVERISGGPVHAARTLALPQDGVPMFTVQTLPDDGGTVEVPEAEQDLSLLNK
ncbi:DUF5719 family protein [Streptomyces sp. P1-3]|uniref:DUF5719 family protein n=1 Tax=Streptomyces sp. P1-3 TaxID=3421658 RepID=UPI003D35D886